MGNPRLVAIMPWCTWCYRSVLGGGQESRGGSKAVRGGNLLLLTSSSPSEFRPEGID